MAMTEKEQILAQLDWAMLSLGDVYDMLNELRERLERTDIRAERSKAGTPGKSPGATVPSAEPTSASKSAFERSLCEESGYEDPETLRKWKHELYEDVDKGEG